MLAALRSTLVLTVLLAACGGTDTTLCRSFYMPYPDFVSQRQRSTRNAPLLDAMAAYNSGNFPEAAAGLSQVIDADASDKAARMYLASALLGAGEPYKAEMHLDFLERDPSSGFKDQVEWYNALCWLCSGQYERALLQAQAITRAPAHTYKTEATDLVKTLTAH
jgi:tetratricopeptide (TPR) repeat protein